MVELTHPDDMARGVGNCGVVALSVATQLPYLEVFSWFARRHRANWRGGTRSVERLEFLEHCAVPFSVDSTPGFSGRTLLQFARWTATSVGRCRLFMVTTTGHVQLVRSGDVLDQGYVGPVAQYRRRLKRLRRPALNPIVEILGAPA